MLTCTILKSQDVTKATGILTVLDLILCKLCDIIFWGYLICINLTIPQQRRPRPKYSASEKAFTLYGSIKSILNIPGPPIQVFPPASLDFSSGTQCTLLLELYLRNLKLFSFFFYKNEVCGVWEMLILSDEVLLSLVDTQVSFAQEIKLQPKLLRNLPLIFDGPRPRQRVLTEFKL